MCWHYVSQDGMRCLPDGRDRRGKSKEKGINGNSEKGYIDSMGKNTQGCHTSGREECARADAEREGCRAPAPDHAEQRELKPPVFCRGPSFLSQGVVRSGILYRPVGLSGIRMGCCRLTAMRRVGHSLPL